MVADFNDPAPAVGDDMQEIPEPEAADIEEIISRRRGESLWQKLSPPTATATPVPIALPKPSDPNMQAHVNQAAQVELKILKDKWVLEQRQ